MLQNIETQFSQFALFFLLVTSLGGQPSISCKMHICKGKTVGRKYVFYRSEFASTLLSRKRHNVTVNNLSNSSTYKYSYKLRGVVHQAKWRHFFSSVTIPYSFNSVQWCQRVMQWSSVIIAHMPILRRSVYPRNQSQTSVGMRKYCAYHWFTRLRHCTELDKYGVVTSYRICTHTHSFKLWLVSLSLKGLTDGCWYYAIW